jgi:hypothetical protein
MTRHIVTLSETKGLALAYSAVVTLSETKGLALAGRAFVTLSETKGLTARQGDSSLRSE